MANINYIKYKLNKMSSEAYESIDNLYKNALATDAKLEAEEVKNALEDYFNAKNSSIHNNSFRITDIRKKRLRKFQEDFKATIVIGIIVMITCVGLTNSEEREDIWRLIKQKLDKPAIEQEDNQELKDLYNIGDSINISKDAKIYTSYLEAAHEINSSKTINENNVSTTTGIGYIMPNHEFKYASNAYEESELESMGGVPVSIQADDSYYNIDDIETAKKGR